MKRVIFINRLSAERIKPKKEDKAAIISINSDKDLANLHENWEYKLYLVFHDLDKAYEGLIIFNDEHARQILDFLEEVKDCNIVVVHCDAGVSRSAAVAKFIAEKFNLYFDDKYSIYNRLVYSTLKWVDSGIVVPVDYKPLLSTLRKKIKFID